MSYQPFEDLEAFIGALSERGITGVGLRSVREVRPVAEGSGITVGHMEWVTLRAYDRGAILSVRVDGADPHALRARLERLGLTVRAGSDNLT